jgi:hypothetical protein
VTALPQSYAAARAAFLGAAQAAGARLSSLPDPTGPGREGEALAMDIARTGPQSGGPVVVVISGLHGVEGLAGSAVQCRWLAQAPADHAMVFVHAANPWGFSHLTRCDAGNVDLNRNLLDDFGALPANPGYARLHPALREPAWTEDAMARQDAALAAFAAEHGAQALTDALIGGQYDFPDGMNYGGAALAWPVAALRDLVKELAAHHSGLLLLDLHTGVAPAGEAAVLPFAGPSGTPDGRHLLTAGDPRFAIGAPGLAAMTGVLAAGLARHVAPVPMLATVVEFGTVTRAEIRRALRLDLALRVATPPDAATEAAARRAVVEAFFPSDPAWRTALAALADTLAQTVLDRGAVVRALGVA